jgi:hypothetical protein
MSLKSELIYKLDGIDADDGVNIFEIAPILMSFGDLIRSANDVLGLEYKIDVKVKPFKEGSWITEFVLQSNIVNDLLNYIHTQEGNNVLTLLALLGLDAKTGIHGVANIIRFTKGNVSAFIHKGDGEKVEYINEKGEKITVSLAEHKLIQSPVIQINYYNSIVSPLDKFPSASSVSTKINKEGSTEQVFSEKDKECFETYAKTELLEDVEENVSTLNKVLLKPKRGSYSGEEKAYSFIMGDNSTLWPVSIEDEDFLNKLQNGEIRPYTEDILKVNLEIRQKTDSKNKIMTHYSIKKVLDYIKYEKPKQLNLGSFSNEKNI